MNDTNSISDREFTTFLHGLGVDTFNKSFEWKLNNAEFGEILRWIYNNVDHNNALTAREECRYAEIEKKGKLLFPEDLEATLISIQQEYSGICLPGDYEALEDVKLDIKMQKERCVMLERHERVLKDMLTQNEVIKQELDKELIELNAALRQCDEDEADAAQECQRLAEEVDGITSEVVEVVGDTLSLYSSCCRDKEAAKRFLTFGPFDTYRQAQSLFRSHFNLYTTKNFDKRNDDVTEDDLRAALFEARSMEGRLTDALFEYIDSKVELSGEQAKLALVAKYNDVHPTQITSCMLEAQSSLELLEQEEAVLVQQVRGAVQQLVARRTRLAVDSAAHCALGVRQQLSSALSRLVAATRGALAADRLLGGCLRHELRAARHLQHCAHHLRAHVLEERAHTHTRIQSMLDITAEQEAATCTLQASDVVTTTLASALHVDTSEPLHLVQRHGNLLNAIRELEEMRLEGFGDREKSLEEFKSHAEPLRQYVFSGSTRAAARACAGGGASAATRALLARLTAADRLALDITQMLHAVKNGDKHNLRKLWQWFLTDPGRLLALVGGSQGRSM